MLFDNDNNQEEKPSIEDELTQQWEQDNDLINNPPPPYEPVDMTKEPINGVDFFGTPEERAMMEAEHEQKQRNEMEKTGEFKPILPLGVTLTPNTSGKRYPYSGNPKDLNKDKEQGLEI